MLEEATLILGADVAEVGAQYDYNGDGIINVIDAYLCLSNVYPPLLPDIGTLKPYPGGVPSLLESFREHQSAYGRLLERYPTIDGRVLLLYLFSNYI